MNPERFARIRQMLAMRQPDLTVCLEEVHKPHNLAAMIRTCDAVGIHDGADALRDFDDRHSFHFAAERTLDLGFGYDVDGRSAVVQD